MATRGLQRIVVVGGGLAGVRSAEALRHLGFAGSVTLLSGETHAPYDRPALSKGVLTGAKDPADTVFRAAGHYADLDIDLRLGVPATGLDLGGKVVRTAHGDVPFDGLVIATGSGARPLPRGVVAPGAAVHLLRTVDDAVRLRAALRGASHLVVIGGGFIGSEVAASARSLGVDVTLVESAPVPLARVVGVEVGAVCADLHRAHGTRLLTGAHVTAIEGDADGCRVALADGRRVHGDVVVVGVGAFPLVQWLDGSGLAVDDDGLACDAFLNAGHPDVYAAGDVVRWPNQLLGASMRSEQWTNALEQARRAAANLLAGDGARSPHGGSGYFWSDQYGSRLQSAGTGAADEVRIVQGDPGSFAFTALYRRGDRLGGAFAMNQGGPFVRSKLLVERGESWRSALSLADSGGLAA